MRCLSVLDLVTQQKGNKDIKSLNAHNSVTIGPTDLADPSLESSFHALSDLVNVW